MLTHGLGRGRFHSQWAWYLGTSLTEGTVKKIVLDADLRTRLGGGAAKLTLTDEAGNSVGHYLPDDLYRSICDALIPLGETDRAEAREEYRRGEVATTTQLLADLRESLARWNG